MIWLFLSGVINSSRQTCAGSGNVGTGSGAVVCPEEWAERDQAATPGNPEEAAGCWRYYWGYPQEGKCRLWHFQDALRYYWGYPQEGKFRLCDIFMMLKISKILGIFALG